MRRVFWGLVVGLAGYELIAVLDRKEGDAISEIVWESAARRPLVPFALGMLMGHFFWQRTGGGGRDG